MICVRAQGRIPFHSMTFLIHIHITYIYILCYNIYCIYIIPAVPSNATMSSCTHYTYGTPISAITPWNQSDIMSSTLPSWTPDRAPRLRLQVWTASHQVTVHEDERGVIRSKENKGGEWKWTTTHPIVIKHAPLDLVQDIPRRVFKRPIHVVSRFRAGFDEQQALFAGPLGCFCGGDLALFERGGGDRGVRGG